MALVDADGRIFGRWNLLDAIIAVLLVGLLPLGYGAYALFKTPPPILTAVEPATLTAGDNLRVVIRGIDLRPFLRVSFDNYQGRTFLFSDSTRAEVELNDMPPGVYDVVLYDHTKERWRLPKAFTLLPPPRPLPTTQVTVVGRFTSLTAEQVAQVKPGMSVPGIEVIEVGQPTSSVPKVYSGGLIMDLPVARQLQVPVRIRLGCEIRVASGYPECFALNFPLRPTYIGQVTTPIGVLSFQVDQFSGSEPSQTAQVTVRFSGAPSLLSQLRVGDVDLGIADNQLAAGATIAAMGPLEDPGAETARREVTLQINVHSTAGGLIYVTSPVRLGGGLSFRTPRYELSGTVLAITRARSAALGAAR